MLAAIEVLCKPGALKLSPKTQDPINPKPYVPEALTLNPISHKPCKLNPDIFQPPPLLLRLPSQTGLKLAVGLAQSLELRHAQAPGPRGRARSCCSVNPSLKVTYRVRFSSMSLARVLRLRPRWRGGYAISRTVRERTAARPRWLPAPAGFACGRTEAAAQMALAGGSILRLRPRWLLRLPGSLSGMRTVAAARMACLDVTQHGSLKPEVCRPYKLQTLNPTP